jgi:erythromycin esterase-like protein
MDITAPAPAIRAVLAALRDAGYEGFEEDWFRLDLLDGGDWQGALQAMQSLPGEEAQAILAAHASLHIQLERTGVGEWPRFARLARAATDGQEMFLAADLAAMGEVREEGMAAVVLDLLETDLAGRRVVIWDHNLHAARATFRMPAVEADLTPLGSLLGQALGDDYLAVGAAFGQGSFPADLPPGERAFPVLSGETVDGAMAGADVGVCLLDLRTVDGEVAAWWNTARPSRAQEFEATLVPAKAFDLLFYTPEVTRSRPSPAALARYASR